MELNQEALLLELEEFNRGKEEDKAISISLENFIEHVSKTGVYVFPWIKIQKVYLQKLKNVLNNLSPLNVNTSANTYLQSTESTTTNIQFVKERILERMQLFTNAPFTIQRISELLVKPNKNYKRTDKFLRGLEKCVMVVTTIDPNGNKIFVDSYSQENGLTPPSSSDSTISMTATAITESITPVRPATPTENNIEMTTVVEKTELVIVANEAQHPNATGDAVVETTKIEELNQIVMSEQAEVEPVSLTTTTTIVSTLTTTEITQITEINPELSSNQILPLSTETSESTTDTTKSEPLLVDKVEEETREISVTAALDHVTNSNTTTSEANVAVNEDEKENHMQTNMVLSEAVNNSNSSANTDSTIINATNNSNNNNTILDNVSNNLESSDQEILAQSRDIKET